MLLAYQTLGDPGVVESDESKVAPRGGDEDILNAAKLLKCSNSDFSTPDFPNHHLDKETPLEGAH